MPLGNYISFRDKQLNNVPIKLIQTGANARQKVLMTRFFSGCVRNLSNGAQSVLDVYLLKFFVSFQIGKVSGVFSVATGIKIK